MRKSLALSFAASTLLLASSLAAHAESVGSLVCTGGGSFNKESSSNVNATLSYFDLGGAAPATAGIGAGKLTSMPLQVHVALSQFNSFYTAFQNGGLFTTCVLNATAGKTSFTVNLRDVSITSLNAVASTNVSANGGSPAAFAYLQVNLAYTGIQVDAMGANDGGTSPGAAWNAINNKSDRSGVVIQ